MKIPEDPYIRELLPEFVDTWIQDVETQMPELLATENGDELYRLAHTIKGSCFQFGLDTIAEMGIKLMGFAKTKDWGNSKILGEEILATFREVKVFLEEQGLYS